MQVKNKTNEAINAIHFTLPTDFKVKIDLPNATLSHDDKIKNYQIYDLANPLAAGDNDDILLFNTTLWRSAS